MLNTLNMALIRCPTGISEEIIAVFQMKKSRIGNENDKHPKFSIFQGLSAFRINFLKDVVNWKVFKGQHGNDWLSKKRL